MHKALQNREMADGNACIHKSDIERFYKAQADIESKQSGDEMKQCMSHISMANKSSKFTNGPVAQLVRASPCHGEGRGFESLLGRKWDLSSAGRASALQAEGHRFEPCRPHYFKKIYAGMAELADAQDLKSCGTNLPYRFDSGRRHEFLEETLNLSVFPIFLSQKPNK